MSCARPQAPPRWTAPEDLILAAFRASEAAVLAYYTSKTESPSEALKILKAGADSLLAAVESARADTLALVPREREAYRRALYFLKGYARILRDTSLVYDAVRFTGHPPPDPGLEEACAILCVLAFQHGALDGVEKAFSRSFTQEEHRAMKSSYGTILMGGPGPVLRLWPAPDPGRPGQGPVLEAWAENDTTAMPFPILELRESRFISPGDTVRGAFYLYGPGGEIRGDLRDKHMFAREGKFVAGAYYLALPSRILWWDTTGPTLADKDSLALACQAYLSSVGIKPDSVSLHQVAGFWVWEGRPGFLVFGNAIKGRKITVFYAVVEGGKALYGEIMPPRGEFYGVELVSAIDLDYDRISEVILSAEGEDSRFYIVLRKSNGVWWKVYRSEPITEF